MVGEDGLPLGLGNWKGSNVKGVSEENFVGWLFVLLGIFVVAAHKEAAWFD
jgi:hypothetical protein